MGFLQKLFGTKSKAKKSNADFWNWFQINSKVFFDIVKKQNNVEKGFLNKLSPKFNEIRSGFYFLTGMFDDNTAELIITADGEIKNLFFVEELVQSAPHIEGWKFTALKPASDIEKVSIKFSGHKFDKNSLHFYPVDNINFPDEINITVVHNDFNDTNNQTITTGIQIFLDNYLGELNFATTIDNLTIVNNYEANNNLVPIEKLNDFLIWRQKEFVEKYEGSRYDTENDTYSTLTAELANGRPLVAIINTDLLDWDRKASHPWILNVEIKFDGKDNNGMPSKNEYQLLNEIEDNISKELKDFEGYLNIGRQTANGDRDIYFACKDFRRPSNVLSQIQSKYTDRIAIEYIIYKDKYWQTLSHFNGSS